MDIPQWLMLLSVLMAVAVIAIQFGRQSFTQKIAPYRFNERGISTIAFGLLYFLLYAVARTPVLAFFGVGDEYLTSDGVLLEMAVVVATLGWCGWLTHNFVRENDVTITNRLPWLVATKR